MAHSTIFIVAAPLGATLPEHFPLPPTLPQKVLEVRTRRNKNFGFMGGLCCAVCAPPQRGGVPAPCGRGCARTAQTPPSSNRSGSAKKNHTVRCIWAAPRPNAKRCACTLPPPGHHYNPSQEGTCHREIRIQQPLVSGLLNKVRLPLAPLTLLYIQIISNPSRSIPPPWQQQTRRRKRSAAPFLES